MTSESKRTITLTDRPPVRIAEDQWPVIAHGHFKHWDNKYEFQANRTWTVHVRVRRHQDGRAIVYGTYEYDTRFQGEWGETHRVGALLDSGAHLPSAIRAIAEQLIDRVSESDMHRHIREAADECIADLPAEELS